MTEPIEIHPALVGQRIRLIAMPQDPDPVPAGSTGTVNHVQELWRGNWQIGVSWDNGRTLALAVPPDTFEVV